MVVKLSLSQVNTTCCMFVHRFDARVDDVLLLLFSIIVEWAPSPALLLNE